MERRIRRTKREVMGIKTALDSCSDPKLKFDLQLKYNKISSLLHRQNTDYNNFCKNNHLKPLRDRLKIAKWSREEAAKSAGAARRYEQAKNKI